MVGLSAPEQMDHGGGVGDSDGDEPSESGGNGVKQGPVFDPADEDVPEGTGGQEVSFGADESEASLSVREAVELSGEMLTKPEQFGIASLGSIRDLEQESKALREAIVDLAEAVEVLSRVQADVAGSDESATVLLDSEAYGEIYEPENG